MTELLQALEQFKHKANAHTRIANLIKGWEPTIEVESTQPPSTRFIAVRAGRIESIATHCPPDGPLKPGHRVHLRGTDAVLTDVFQGRCNPARAFLDGQLEIFADDKDHVKLDAISLVLWGA